VMRNGKLKIADFGIARIDSSNLTHVGAVMGTPGYMAPEQYTGTQVDSRADIFSAGVVMYELLAGVKPFVGRLEAVAYKVCNEHPPPPSQLPFDPPAVATYDAIIARAIAKKPEQRFQSAAEFRTALLEAYDAPVSAVLSEETLITEALPPVRLEPSSTPSMSSGAASTGAASSGRSTAPPAGWDPALLKEIERHFARVVGPVAKVLVRRAGRQTLDLDELYAELAASLASDEERRAFMATRSALTIPPTPAPRRATLSGTRAPVPKDMLLTAESIEAAQRKLAVYIGPIARVMAKKAAAQTDSALRFYLMLADNLSGSERERFLNELGVDAAARSLR
jgi:hypothetical protein